MRMIIFLPHAAFGSDEKHDDLLALFDVAELKCCDVSRSPNLEDRSTFSVGDDDFELP